MQPIADVTLNQNRNPKRILRDHAIPIERSAPFQVKKPVQSHQE
jgi:hypothetical protein